MKKITPRITIGVPAYKNATTLKASVETLLAQEYSNFCLLISDDNSPDETHLVCLDLASRDSRIEYVRQPKNLKYQNFGFLLRQARTEYFMWAAGDDQWHPDFIRRCIDALDARPDVVLVTPRVRFVNDKKDCGLSNGTYSLLDGLEENLCRFLAAPKDNSRMYGVFRTEAGQKCFPASSFHAYDWAFSAALLRYGCHLELPYVLMERDLTPSENYARLAAQDSKELLYRLFPILKMSIWLLSQAGIPKSRRVLGVLFAANMEKHFQNMGISCPRYSKLISPIRFLWRRYLAWRFFA